jgi:hypothetical protein
VLFPEVFLRSEPGFDVLIGNPPWEEVVFDEPRFWARFSPGLMGKPVQHRDGIIADLKVARQDLALQAKRAREESDQIRIILTRAYPLGKGDADLYKAFAWRMWRLTRKRGRIGVVLPKTAFSAVGLEEWRREVLQLGSLKNLTTLVNNGGWVFEGVHPQYTIALASIVKDSDVEMIELAGVYSSKADYKTHIETPVIMSKTTVLLLTGAASIPTISTQLAADVLTSMRRSPRLSDALGGKIRLVSEFHATNDREFFDTTKQDKSVPVYSGASFNLWKADTGEVFAWANREIATTELLERLDRQIRLKSSAFYGLDKKRDLGDMLPFERPRLAFRGITNPTNSRTCIAAIVPAQTLLTNISPYVLFPIKHERTEAYLCGVMSSLPFDWYARRFIETQMNFHFVNAFPVPTGIDTPLGMRCIEIAAVLSAQEPRLKEWASAVGVETRALSPADCAAYVAELDAVVAHLFGLSGDQLSFIYASFHRGWNASKPDYVGRYESAMKHYDTWAAKA